jgi:hypothetical protein
MSNIDSLAAHLLKQGLWSEAVELYRDELGLTIQQAERIVAGLAEETGITIPGRFMSWLALALGGLSLFLLAGLLQWVASPVAN